MSYVDFLLHALLWDGVGGRAKWLPFNKNKNSSRETVARIVTSGEYKMRIAKSRKELLLCGVFLSANLGLIESATADGAFESQSPWMLGDWGGARSDLQEKGYTIDASYISELAFNAHGGYDKNGKLAYVDQFAFGVAMDLQKILSIPNARFQVMISNRNGDNLTGERLTDPRSGPVTSTMEVYGRGQVWRLNQMFYQQSWLDNKLDLKVGRMSPSDDFQSFPCDFQNVAFCGAQAGMWVGDDWYAYPIGQWGTRFKVAVAPELFFQAGVYEHNRTLRQNNNGFKLSTSGANGVILPVELLWTPSKALFDLPGEYRVGAYRMNINADDKFEDVNGQPKALTGAEAKNRDRRSGVWAMARQQVAQFDGNANRSVEVFAQAHANDRHTSFVDRFYSAGIVVTGPFAARPGDQVAFAVGKAHVNEKIRDNQRLLNGLAGATNYDDPNFTPEQSSEYMAELYYGMKATNWLTLRPNIQYLHNPGAVREVEDAVVTGLKIIAVF
ncbi:carbohydrate porin [Pseudomonas kurunegalensis]|uniref:carbohydrate porin n=1 Tax=Pseudomonas kurunegalensis TaxID=485880 RepID=UPI002570605F|nr:carbohydrate porin [Pseudomonas kurunegalensis]WJD60696.1 carbohydrate porin [Pseudomonas kurunegalensis]